MNDFLNQTKTEKTVKVLNTQNAILTVECYGGRFPVAWMPQGGICHKQLGDLAKPSFIWMTYVHEHPNTTNFWQGVLAQVSILHFLNYRQVCVCKSEHLQETVCVCSYNFRYTFHSTVLMLRFLI